MLQISPRIPLSELSGAISPVDQRLSPRDVISFWRRYVLLIISCMACCVALGEAYVLVTPSTYAAASQILIESRRASGFAATSDVSYAQYSLDSSQIENQIQIIKSEQTSRRVVRAMQLDENQNQEKLKASVLSSLRGYILGNGDVATPPDRTTMAMRDLLDRLQVRRIGQSYVLEISYWSEDPVAAARICNAITAAYFQDLLGSKIDAAKNGSELLEQRISLLRDQWATADEAVRTGTLDVTKLATPEARVITMAALPSKRSWPHQSLILAFSALLGLFVALVSAAVHRSLDTSIRTLGQVERDLCLNVLGVLPNLRFRCWPSIANEFARNPLSPFSMAVRQIKTSIQLQQTGGPLVCIGVTAVTSREGRTTAIANLARAFAASGSHTLVIDADLRHRRLTRALQRTVNMGLYELLNEETTLEQVLIRGAPGQPDFIPASRSPTAGASEDLVGSKRMSELLGTCRKFYSVVLIALPTLEEAPDTRAVAGHLDGIAVVIGFGRLPSYRIATALRSFDRSNVKILGVIINKGRHVLTH
ncbi:tyrosine-protein kinase domain-containing protein [Methylobacterium nodulans]|uniref:Lipopolysaccharide biosynthesis protein n=1 Tax=Methylobacterium nodulans (strain LMG 21967 / CNCM I-2342 / ORS 2060) TaxID=460265 RepID=B8IGI5_METNO|nr:tyrosine-protein kinase domain-containing protein [Methylobacterium nodulans]ACL55885.1 lipopolysaccharide biosynthesis protein [Methylobacterium nodulans ORS 2060]